MTSPPSPSTVCSDQDVIYSLVPGGSARNGDLLLDSLGYTYTKKREARSSTTWICSVRTRSLRCNATVNQQGETFTRSTCVHVHAGDPGAAGRVNARTVVKETVRTNFLKMASGDADRSNISVDGSQQMTCQLPAGTSCDGCGNGLKVRQIAVQCDRCDTWHMLLGSESLPETRHTSEGFQMFSFPCADCPSGDEKPSIFIFMQQQTNKTVPKFEPFDEYPPAFQNGQSNPLTYHIVEGPHMDRPQLEDSDGHRYTARGNRNGATVWRCIVRRRGAGLHGTQTVDCPAAVAQRGDKFSLGRMPHNHAVGESALISEDSESAQSGITCEVSQGHVSCEITDAQITPLHMADEVVDPPPTASLTYNVIVGGTHSGNDVLVDSRGYSYRRKYRSSCEKLRPGAQPRQKSMFWRCSVYNNRIKCLASVIQKGNSFLVGKRSHVHPPGRSAARAVAISTQTDRGSLRKIARLRRQEQRKHWPLRKHVEGVTYERVEGSSKRHRSLLVDSLGYSYTLKREGRTTQWRCSMRNASHVCHAGVTQVGDSFIPGLYAHVHPPREMTFKAIGRLKDRVINELFRPLPQIVDEVMSEFRDSGMKLKRANLLRVASRYRAHVIQVAEGDGLETVDVDATPLWEVTVKSEEMMSGAIPSAATIEALVNSDTLDKT